MSKTAIKIIVVVTSIALIGLITTQTFWVNNAIHLSKNQFNHRVDMALDDVMKEMLSKNNGQKYIRDTNYHNKDYGPKNIVDVFQYNNLDSLLSRYFTYHKVEGKYEYRIMRSCRNQLVYKSAQVSIKTKKTKPHYACFNSLWEPKKYHIEVYFPAMNKNILLSTVSWILLSTVFIVIIIFSFTFTILSILKEKKISEIRDDFINNMTHEFKTPISTISVASEMLMSPGAISTKDKLKNYAKIIFDENKRMKSQVDRVLQAAMLSKDAFEMNKTPENLHELIMESVPKLLIDNNEEKIKVNYILKAKNPDIFVDKMHLINIIKNLIENAIKYSNSKLEINIYSINFEQGVLFSVEDNGIGMSQDTLKHIFDKFYRRPTGDLHNIKGFGLGLYYVKSIAEAHGGYINVKSEMNKGSRFDIYLPFDK